jgi:hypothetical protein
VHWWSYCGLRVQRKVRELVGGCCTTFPWQRFLFQSKQEPSFSHTHAPMSEKTRSSGLKIFGYDSVQIDTWPLIHYFTKKHSKTSQIT